ncbi:MAG: TIR domain-containing protein, partial [Gammaproteobacteria bacterium]|nr:TIR domain-containing protein [Gammaproteobacteria bacterium]
MDKPFPAYDGKEPYIFVCYAHADASVVYPEIQWLRGHGLNIWYDEGITPGENWLREIGERVDRAERVLFYVSAHSIESIHCRREIGYALTQARDVLPVYVEQVSLPKELAVGLSIVQALDRGAGGDAYRSKLLDALRREPQTVYAEARSRPANERRRRIGTTTTVAALSLAMLIGAGFWYWPGPQDARKLAGPQISSIPSIAVLPFVNASGDPTQQYFSDGVSEELINALARMPGLHVAARSSSFQFSGSLAGIDFSEIARQLGVESLVEGSVRRVENTVRVTASLVSADDGFQVWSDSFDREVTDIFAIQDEIAGAIADALKVHLTLDGTVESGVPRAASIDAYNLYLLGRHHFENRTVLGFEQAQRYFEGAIERDPGYAPAYNGLADSILLQSDEAYGAVPVEQSIAAALPLIEKSLELDASLAETHLSLGFLRMSERDLLASEAALKRAIELNANLSRAHNWLYVTYGLAVQHKKAFESLQRAFALDPLSPVVNANMAAEWWIRNRTDDALQAAERIMQFAPDGPLGFRRTGRIKWTSGELAEAVGWYRESINKAPADRNSKLELGALLVDLGMYGEAMGLLGDQRYVALLAQGRMDDALAIVRASLAKRPDHLGTIFAAAHSEARAGNYDRVRALLDPLANGAGTGGGSLFLRSGIHFWDPQIAATDLAVALLETGENEAGLELLAEVTDYFALL